MQLSTRYDHLVSESDVYGVRRCFICRDSRILSDRVLQRFVPWTEWRHTDDVSGVRPDATGTLHPRRLQPWLFQRRRLVVRRPVLRTQVVRRQCAHAGRHTAVPERLRFLSGGQLYLYHRCEDRSLVSHEYSGADPPLVMHSYASAGFKKWIHIVVFCWVKLQDFATYHFLTFLL